MPTKKLTGKISPDRIVSMEVPRPPREVVDGFLALTDLAGTVSDAMDELGIGRDGLDLAPEAESPPKESGP